MMGLSLSTMCRPDAPPTEFAKAEKRFIATHSLCLYTFAVSS